MEIKEFDKLEKIYAAGASTYDTLLPEKHRKLFNRKMSYSFNPQEAKAKWANKKYFEKTYGADRKKVSKKYDLYVNAFLKKHFPATERKNELDLFNKIGGVIQKDRNKIEFTRTLLGEANKHGTTKGGDWNAHYNETISKLAEHEGYEDEGIDRYQEIFKEAFENANTTHAALREEAGLIFDFLADKHGVKEKNEEAAEDIDYDQIRNILLSIPDESRPALYQMLQSSAEELGVDKGFWKQTGEALGRGFKNYAFLSHKYNLDEGFAQNTINHVDEGKDMWVRKDDSHAFWESKDKNLQSRWFPKQRPTYRKATQEERKKFREDAETSLKIMDIDKEIGRIAEGIIDPVKGDNFVTEKIWYPFTGNLGYMSQSLVPYAGIPLVLSSTANIRFDEIRERNPGIDRKDAMNMAMISAVPEAVIERLQGLQFIGRVPMINKLMTQPKKFLPRFFSQLATHTALQNVEEGLQDITPLFVQEISSYFKKEIPSIDWEKELDVYKNERIDTALAMIPMVLIGAGIGSAKADNTTVEKYLNDTSRLKLTGISDENIKKIIEAKEIVEKKKIFKEAYKKKSDVVAKKAIVESEKANDEVSELQARKDAPSIKRDAKGTFQVENKDGDVVAETKDFEKAKVAANEEMKNTPVSNERILSSLGVINDFVGNKKATETKSTKKEKTKEHPSISEAEAADMMDIASMDWGQSSDSTAKEEGKKVFSSFKAPLGESAKSDIEGVVNGKLDFIIQKTDEFLKKIEKERPVIDDIKAWKQKHEDGGGEVVEAKTDKDIKRWLSNMVVKYVVGDYVKRDEIPHEFRNFLEQQKVYADYVLGKAAEVLKQKNFTEKANEQTIKIQENKGLGKDQASRTQDKDYSGEKQDKTELEKGVPASKDAHKDKNSDALDKVEVSKDKAVDNTGKVLDTPVPNKGVSNDKDMGKEIDKTISEEIEGGKETSEDSDTDVNVRGESEAIDKKTRETKITERVASGDHKGKKFSKEVREYVSGTLYQVSETRPLLKKIGGLINGDIEAAKQAYFNETNDLTYEERVTLGSGLAVAFNKSGDYETAAEIIENLGLRGTRHGQAINRLKLLGLSLDSPAAVQAFFNKKIKKAKEGVVEEINEAVEALEGELKTESTKPESIAEKPAKRPKKDKKKFVEKVVQKVESKTKKPVTRKTKKAVRKAADLWQRGTLTQEDVKKIITKLFDFPKLDGGTMGILSDHAKKISRTPPGSFERSNAVADLMKYINNQLNEYDIVDLLWSSLYQGILSGSTTAVKNVGDTFINAALDSMLDCIEVNKKGTRFHPIETIQNLSALFNMRGIKTGTIEAGAALRGESTIGIQQKKWSFGNVFEDTKPRGLFYPYRLSKYVPRSLIAQDTWNWQTARESFASVRALRMAREMEKSDKILKSEIKRKVEELLFLTKEQTDDFQERAAGEWENMLPEDSTVGKKAVEKAKGDEVAASMNLVAARAKWIKRRVDELKILSRDGALSRDASDLATRATYTNNSEGVVGVIVESIGTALHGYQDSSKYGLSKPQKVALKTMTSGGRFLMLFTRVLGNVFSRRVDYLGMGLARGALGQTVALKAGKVDAVPLSFSERMLAIKRGVFGATVLSALLFSDPEDKRFKIHGKGPDSYDHQKQKRNSGWIPYSIEVDGKHFSYLYTPLSLVFAMVGMVHDWERYDQSPPQEAIGTVFAYAATGAAGAMLDQSMLTTIGDFFDSLSREGESRYNAVSRFVKKTVNPSNNLPLSNLLKQSNRMADEYMREKRTMLAELMSAVPVLSQKNNTLLNDLGEPIESKFWGWLYSKKKNPEESDSARIWVMLADKDLKLSSTWRYRNQLGLENYRKFVVIRGGIVKKNILESIDALEKADNETAQKFIKKVCKHASTYAKTYVMNKIDNNEDKKL
jgi:hypothetical protein